MVKAFSLVKAEAPFHRKKKKVCSLLFMIAAKSAGNRTKQVSICGKYRTKKGFFARIGEEEGGGKKPKKKAYASQEKEKRGGR